MKNALTIFIFLIYSNVVLSKNFKGAEIYSQESFLYGRFEMKIKAAQGSGQLSTFFLYRNGSETATTLWQEIDIEIFGKDSNIFQSNVIVEAVEGKKQMTEILHKTPKSLSADFHIYTLEWTPDSICWFLDNSLLRTEKINAKRCNAAMSMRLNHWAADIVSWVGPFDKTVLPQYQYVDWIQYSKFTPGQGDNGSNFTLQWKDDFSTFDNSRWAKANWSFSENLVDFLPENAYSENNLLVLKLHDTMPPILVNETSETTFSVYPNPCTDHITIQADLSKNYSISVLQSDSSVLFPMTILNNNTETLINSILSKCKKGVYYILLYSNNKVIDSEKLIKN